MKKTKYNRKHGGTNKTKKCMDKLYFPKLVKYKNDSKKAIVLANKELKNIVQKIQKTTNEKQKQNLLAKKMALEFQISQSANMITSFRKLTEKLTQQQYCNPGCVATMFETGTTFSKDFMKKFEENAEKIFRYPELSPTKEKEKIQKQKQELLQIYLEERKRMFGNKSDVLVDDFYEGLKPNQIKKMKDAGAISGCVKTFMPTDFKK